MKACLCSTFFTPHTVGGAEPYTQFLAEDLTRRGHQVSVITAVPGSLAALRPKLEVAGGVRIHRFFPANLYSTWTQRDHWLATKAAWRAVTLWNPHAFLVMLSILRRERPDVIHVHNVGSLSFALFSAARLLGIPIVQTVHSPELLCFRTTMLKPSGEMCAHPRGICRLWQRASRHFLRRVKCVISPSRALLEVYRASDAFAGAEEAVLPFGITMPEPPAGPRASARTFLCMGALAPHKGFEDALRAFMRLDAQDARLVIAGRGPLEEQLKSVAAADKRVEFAGFVSGAAKDALLRRADVLVVPSAWHENAPIVIHEAFAYGLPVLGTSICGIPELVTDGTNGRLFEPHDIGSLGALMRELAQDGAQVERLSRGALEFARGRTWDGHMAGLLGIYEKHRLT